MSHCEMFATRGQLCSVQCDSCIAEDAAHSDSVTPAPQGPDRDVMRKLLVQVFLSCDSIAWGNLAHVLNVDSSEQMADALLALAARLAASPRSEP